MFVKLKLLIFLLCFIKQEPDEKKEKKTKNIMEAKHVLFEFFVSKLCVFSPRRDNVSSEHILARGGTVSSPKQRSTEIILKQNSPS